MAPLVGKVLNCWVTVAKMPRGPLAQSHVGGKPLEATPCIGLEIPAKNLPRLCLPTSPSRHLLPLWQKHHSRSLGSAISFPLLRVMGSHIPPSHHIQAGRRGAGNEAPSLAITCLAFHHTPCSSQKERRTGTWQRLENVAPILLQ